MSKTIALPETKLVEKASSFFGVKGEDILSNRRYADYVKPRHIVMLFLSQYIGYRDSAIAKIFGCNRTTVVHARTRFQGYLKYEDDLRAEIENFREFCTVS